MCTFARQYSPLPYTNHLYQHQPLQSMPRTEVKSTHVLQVQHAQVPYGVFPLFLCKQLAVYLFQFLHQGMAVGQLSEHDETRISVKAKDTVDTKGQA